MNIKIILTSALIFTATSLCAQVDTTRNNRKPVPQKVHRPNEPKKNIPDKDSIIDKKDLPPKKNETSPMDTLPLVKPQ